MRALALLSVFAAIHQSTHVAAQQPFLDTLSPRSSRPLFLLKRQTCPSDTTSCSSLGNADACCPNNTVCAKDQNGNIACCPNNAVCTGVISGSATGRTSTTSGFVLGTTTTTAPPTTSAPTTLPSGYSTVPNQYYPFVAIPNSYANSQACLSAYTTCQSASTACFNSLAGQNGVTVSGLGTEGVTQLGATGTVAVSASSICSSLYNQGCYGLQSSQCNSFGSAGATQTTGFVQVNGGQNGIARCTGAFYTAAAAAVVGAGAARIAMI